MTQVDLSRPTSIMKNRRTRQLRYMRPAMVFLSSALTLLLICVALPLHPTFARAPRSAQRTTITVFRVPRGMAPYGLTAGPDHNLWFTDHTGSIGRMTQTGAFKEFALPKQDSNPEKIVRVGDGNLWFTELDANKIGRIAPSGKFKEFTIPTPHSSPEGITPGPDGNLWFTEYLRNKVGRITSSGAITEFAIPTPYSAPVDIITGRDHNLWFIEAHSNRIGRITPAGKITEFALSGRTLYGGIAVGKDNSIWFTEARAKKIGRISASGKVHDFTLPSSSASPLISQAARMAACGSMH